MGWIGNKYNYYLAPPSYYQQLELIGNCAITLTIIWGITVNTTKFVPARSNIGSLKFWVKIKRMRDILEHFNQLFLQLIVFRKYMKTRSYEVYAWKFVQLINTIKAHNSCRCESPHSQFSSSENYNILLHIGFVFASLVL